MTQAVTNTLNNLEQMLSTQDKVQKVSDAAHSAMDKSNDFRKVLETKIDDKSSVKESESDSVSSTIKDVKEKAEVIKSSEQTPVNETIVSKQEGLTSADFKEFLEKITDEANVETSLDLTLARDINEIISQLKEAVEDATEAVEEITENTEEIAAALQNVFPTDTVVMDEEIITDAKLLDAAIDTQIVADDTKADKVVYGQLMTAQIEKEQVLDSDVLAMENSDLLESFEPVQSEIIEFAEVVTDEIVASKPATDSVVDDLENILDEEMLKDLKVESLSSESDMTGNSESFMQSQTPQEHAVRAMITQETEAFEIKIDSSSSIQNPQQVQAKSVDVNPSRIIDQITKHLEGLQNNSKVNIVLNPESLGKVNIQLMSTKDGLTAQFTVTTQEARDLLTKGLDGLKESLGAHGVAVDNVSIKLADAQKSEYNQDWTEQEGSRGGNKEQRNSEREEKQKGLFEKMMAQVTDDENGNV